MMQCRDIDELMVDYLYQELDREQSEAFRSHVSGCARCGAEIKSLERTRQALRALPEAEPSPAVSARLLHEAAKRAASAESGGLLGWIHRVMGPIVAHPAWAAAASLLLVAGVAGFLSLRGKVSEHAQTVALPEGTAASTPAAAPPIRDLPAKPAEAVADKDDKPASAPAPARKDNADRSRDVRELGEGAPAGYAPKVPAPAVATRPKAKPVDEEANKKRQGRTASSEEDLKLAQPKAGAVKGTGDDFGGVPASPPPPPAEADESRHAAGEREAEAPKLQASQSEQLRKEPAKPQPQPSSTYGKAAQAAPAPAAPAAAAEPPPQQATAPANEPLADAQSVKKAETKAKEPPEQELFRLAQKQASGGRCDEALGTRDKIARMNPEFYRKRVAGDASLRACEEQNKQRRSAPARQEQLEASPDLKTK